MVTLRCGPAFKNVLRAAAPAFSLQLLSQILSFQHCDVCCVTRVPFYVFYFLPKMKK